MRVQTRGSCRSPMVNLALACGFALTASANAIAQLPGLPPVPLPDEPVVFATAEEPQVHLAEADRAVVGMEAQPPGHHAEGLSAADPEEREEGVGLERQQPLEPRPRHFVAGRGDERDDGEHPDAGQGDAVVEHRGQSDAEGRRDGFRHDACLPRGRNALRT